MGRSWCFRIYERKAGIEFDPKIVKILVDNIDDFLKIKEKYKDSEETNGEVAWKILSFLIT